MAKRLVHRLCRRLLEHMQLRLASFDQRGSERSHEQADRGKRQQRAVPAHVLEQPLRERQEGKLTK